MAAQIVAEVAALLVGYGAVSGRIDRPPPARARHGAWAGRHRRTHDDMPEHEQAPGRLLGRATPRGR